MSQPYNLTAAENSTSLLELTTSMNDVTGGALGITITMVIFVISFAQLKNWPTRDAFAASSYGTTVFGMLFFLVGLVPDWSLVLYFLMTAGGTVALITRSP